VFGDGSKLHSEAEVDYGGCAPSQPIRFSNGLPKIDVSKTFYTALTLKPEIFRV